MRTDPLRLCLWVAALGGGTASAQDRLVEDWQPLGGSPVSTLIVLDDRDGDGVRDFLVSDARHAVDGVGETGLLRILSGADEQRVLLEVPGPRSGAAFGRPPVAAVGDTDGDGVGDFAVASRTALTLVDGDEGKVLFEALGRPYWIGAAGDADGSGLADFFVCRSGQCALHLDGSEEPSVVYLAPPGGLRFGLSGAVLGDVDGDGFPDLAVADPGALEPQVPGRVVVYSGRGGDYLYEIADLAGDETFGSRVFAPGDVTGDGVPDLVASQGHLVSLHDGRDGSALGTFRAVGALALTPDVDGDGVPELVGQRRVDGQRYLELWSLARGERLSAFPGRGSHLGPPLDWNGRGQPALLVSRGDYPAKYEVVSALPPGVRRRSVGGGARPLVAGLGAPARPGAEALVRVAGLASGEGLVVSTGRGFAVVATEALRPGEARARLPLPLPPSISLFGATLELSFHGTSGRAVILRVEPGQVTP